MLTNDFKGLTLSRLGFGAMRLPLLENGSVDEKQVDGMVDHAIANGVNYFDTAWPYHNGLSEGIIGRSLSRYPRGSWYLADKYPGHQIAESYDPAAVFEEQLKKCGVEYFDFYLLHNVCENSIPVYKDKRWNIVPYFVEQKRLGRIKHLGFSSHARLETLESFLDWAGDSMEFCQLQLNYLDWTLQQGKEKYELLTRRGIPVWVMEPVRGGKLAVLPEAVGAELHDLRPGSSDVSWAFRFLQGLPNVKVILSGMSNIAQMRENTETFRSPAPLGVEEEKALLEAAERLKNSVPCTACRYCTEGCPMGLDIPTLISVYNELKFQTSFNLDMYLSSLPEDKLPSACVACGKCAQICPQSIDIPGVMKDLAAEATKLPSWAEMCRQREEAAKKLAESKK